MPQPWMPSREQFKEVYVDFYPREESAGSSSGWRVADVLEIFQSLCSNRQPRLILGSHWNREGWQQRRLQMKRAIPNLLQELRRNFLPEDAATWRRSFARPIQMC